MRQEFSTVDQYIASFPPEVQEILNKIRAIIREKAPDAWEGISYDMPAYKTHGKVLVYFAGFKHHIGFYATPSGHAEFARELSQFKQGKGSVQFSLNQPIPYELIGQMVEFRVWENNESRKK
ncbi:MAG: DUF1801 domain-containing protein [Bacteroides sp.]|jgi:uncharacterized protein YdhG (YjbR/CyaY superfamily)|nr:DUF1801 domain-containing protein [Bacteroides sp.]